MWVDLWDGGIVIEMMILNGFGFGEGMLVVFVGIFDGTEGLSGNLFVDESIVSDILFTYDALVLKHLN